MWARSTNTPFDWWLVLICCERKIHWLQRTKLQALLFRAVSLLGFCYNIVYLHYIYMVLAQFVLKFSSFPSGLRKVFFSVKSTYDSSDDNGDSFSRIWKAKLPYKIKIFLWLIEQGGLRMLAQLVSHSGGTPQVLNSTPRGSEFQPEGKKIPSLAPVPMHWCGRPRSA